jgi:hypothetical protein
MVDNKPSGLMIIKESVCPAVEVSHVEIGG